VVIRLLSRALEEGLRYFGCLWDQLHVKDFLDFLSNLREDGFESRENLLQRRRKHQKARSKRHPEFSPENRI